MMIRRTNSAANRAAGFSVGRAAVAVALTGVMGLGLVACNEDDDAPDSKMTGTSSSEMTSESKMTEEKMTEDMKGGDPMSSETENMMETDESMMPDLQGKQN